MPTYAGKTPSLSVKHNIFSITKFYFLIVIGSSESFMCEKIRFFESLFPLVIWTHEDCHLENMAFLLRIAFTKEKKKKNYIVRSIIFMCSDQQICIAQIREMLSAWLLLLNVVL